MRGAADRAPQAVYERPGKPLRRRVPRPDQPPAAHRGGARTAPAAASAAARRCRSACAAPGAIMGRRRRWRCGPSTWRCRCSSRPTATPSRRPSPAAPISAGHAPRARHGGRHRALRLGADRHGRRQPRPRRAGLGDMGERSGIPPSGRRLSTGNQVTRGLFDESIAFEKDLPRDPVDKVARARSPAGASPSSRR